MSTFVQYKTTVDWDVTLVNIGLCGDTMSENSAGISELAVSAIKITSGAPNAVVGKWLKGAVVTNAVTGLRYQMTGTTASPVWSLVPSSGSGLDQLTGDVTAGPGSGSQVATIAALAVTTAKIAALAVTGAKIAAGTITADKFSVTLLPVHTTQITLTNAQILALNGTALPVVTALAAGLTATQVIMPIKATMAYTRAVADYATNTELDLIHTGSSQAILKTSIAASASTFAPFVDAASATPSGNDFIANADLNVFVPTGNPTGGNAGSSIKVTVAWVIMDVL